MNLSFTWKHYSLLLVIAYINSSPRSFMPAGNIRSWQANLKKRSNFQNTILYSTKKKSHSLAPRGFQINFSEVIFQLILVTDGWSISCKIVLKWMPMDLTDGKSTLVKVMAWCCQARGHYLSQCWPRSMSPNGVTRPQCVKTSQEI